MNKNSDLKNSSENSQLNSDVKKPFFIAQGNSVHSQTPLKDRFRVLLARKGLSQNQLAEQIGVAIGTMSKIVNGNWYPTTKVMTKIGAALEVDSVILFGDSKYWTDWREKMIYNKEGKN